MQPTLTFAKLNDQNVNVLSVSTTFFCNFKNPHSLEKS